MKGQLPILDNKSPDVQLEEKGVIDLHSYFHVTCALLEDFDIFDNFNQILL